MPNEVHVLRAMIMIITRLRLDFLGNFMSCNSITSDTFERQRY
jgi:hypothetical protein